MTKKIPLLDLNIQYNNLKDKIQEAINRVFEKGQFILGPEVEKFEKEISEYIGCKYSVAVANGSDALTLVLKAWGISSGDEVITSPYTFFASAECASHVGATPVFVDIDPQTYCIDAKKIENAITERTKAIIPVHIFGQACDMDTIMDIAEKHNLLVLEDACQAIGGKYKGNMLGSIGHAAAFSFFPTKNLGGYGDGGIITTNDKELADKLKILRVHGSNPKYYHSMYGFNSRLDALQAAILRVKLPHLDKWNEARKKNAERYDSLITNPYIKKPYTAPYADTIYHLYIILVENRDGFVDYMYSKGITTGIYYPVPLHLQEVYKGLGYKVGDLPITDNIATRAVAIPMYPELGEKEINYISDIINKWENK
jgi:dTDP-4-amino-4,6-dideoxygalactose transaminase